MNKARILELADYIETQVSDDQFYMGNWLTDRNSQEVRYICLDQAREHPCGTVGCIAGWAAVLFKDEPPASRVDIIAMHALNLTPGEAKALFYMTVITRRAAIKHLRKLAA